MELGLSMSMAQQMVNTMNHAMNNMQIPGVNAGTTGQQQIANANLPTPSQWYVVVDGKQAGPLSDAELSALACAGKIKDETFVWQPGMKAWQTACNVPQVNKMILLSGCATKP